MKTNRMFLAITALTVMWNASPVSFAQSGMGGPGGQRYQRLYDTTSVQTLHGEVVAVDTAKNVSGSGAGIHLTLKSDSVSIVVHLGPNWYLHTQSVKIVAGDRITVTGSRIIFRGVPVIVAAEVRKGEKTLRLRNKQGYPLWSGENR